MRDEYRITLFKKKLREIIGCDWVRFYNSKGKCHLCITSIHFGQDNIALAAEYLRQGGIEFKVTRGLFSEEDGRIWSLNIPIDQEALPERSRRVDKFTTRKLQTVN